MGCCLGRDGGREGEGAPLLNGERRPRVFRGRKPEALAAKYELGECIGEGAEGIVYETAARSTSPKSVGRPGSLGAGQWQWDYATKVVRNKGRTNEGLGHEVNMLRHVPRHPNIVALIDEYTTAQNMFIVLERVRGGELFDRIMDMSDDDAFTEHDVACILRDTASGLSHMHAHGIMHRDLKPQNLLCSHKTSLHGVKITDFGFASFDAQGQEVRRSFAGTPAFMAPEVVSLGDESAVGTYHNSVDIWSLGVVLFLMSTGTWPFSRDSQPRGNTPPAGQRGMRGSWVCRDAGAVDFSGQEWAKLSPKLRDAIAKCLTVDPKRRASALELMGHPFVRSEPGKLRQASLRDSVVRVRRMSIDVPDLLKRGRVPDGTMDPALSPTSVSDEDYGSRGLRANGSTVLRGSTKTHAGEAQKQKAVAAVMAAATGRFGGAERARATSAPTAFRGNSPDGPMQKKGLSVLFEVADGQEDGF